MKKVYVVMQFDAQPYESYMDGVHKVFSSKESAEEYVKAYGTGPHWEDEDHYFGYYLSDRIEEREVHA